MKFVFDESKMTWSDLADLEEGRTSRQTIQFMAKMVVNENGEPVKETEALKFVGGLSLPEARRVTAQFRGWIKTLRDGAVNPPTADS